MLFRTWCEERQLGALPASPATVAAFLAHEASRNVKASTIGRRTAAIRYAHKLAGLATPTDDELVKATVRGIRRTLGTAKTKKAPATAERLLAMAANTGLGLKGLRDRALLLLGFAGAFRRSELVALNLEDIEEMPDGMKITIRHSKTDQEGAGQSHCHSLWQDRLPSRRPQRVDCSRRHSDGRDLPQRQPPRQGR